MTISALFWVGGSGTWSSAASWSLTSGGAGGAGVPDSTTVCTFDGNSGTGTSTMDTVAANNCAQVNLATPNITLSLTQPLTCLTFVHSQGTFTTNGQAVTITGTWSAPGQLARTINLGASTIQVGFAFVAGTVLDFTGSGLTLNAGTSSITLGPVSTSSVNTAWSSQPLTYNNVTVIPGGGPASSTTSFGDFDITIDQCTFHNLTFLGTNNAQCQMAVNATTGITVTGTFTATGFSRQTLLGIRSGANYITTIINAAAVSLTNVNFFQITAGGAAAPWTGTGLSDGQGNTGITFPASRSLFWVGNGGTWGDAGGAHWATSTGGTPGAPPPLAQDDVHIDANSITTTGQTIDASASRWLCRDLIMTGLAQAITFITPGQAAAPNTWATFGNITLNSNCTFTNPQTSEWSFRDQRGGVNGTITCNGCTIVNNCRISITGPGTTIQLGGDALFSSASTLLNNGGTFKTNGHALSVFKLTTSATNECGFDVTGSTITILASGLIDASGYNAVIPPAGQAGWIGTSTCNLVATGTNPGFQLGGYSWGSLTFTPTGGGTKKIGNDSTVTWNPIGSTVSSLTFTGSAANTEVLQMVSPLVVTGAVSLSGNSPVNQALVQGINLGQPATITAGSVGAITNVDFMDITAAGASAPWTGTRLGDCQGNTGITMTASAAASWSGATTGNINWNASAGNWSSGRIPLPQDDVTVGGTWTINKVFTLGMPRLCRNLDFSGLAGGPIQVVNSPASSIFGSLTCSTKMNGATPGASLAGAVDIRLCDRRGGSTVTWAGVQPSSGGSITYLRIQAPGGSYTFNDQLIIAAATKSLSLEAGTLHLGATAPSIGGFQSLTTNPRTLDIGSGVLTVFGTASKTGAPVWQVPSTVQGSNPVAIGLTIIGTGIIDFTDTSAAKTFAGGSYLYPPVRYQANTAQGLTIVGTNASAALTLKTSTARTDTLPAAGCQACGALTIQGAAAQLLSVASSTPGTKTYLRLFAKTAVESNASLSADVVVAATGLPTGIL